MRPLNHYLLIGLSVFESDSEVIQSACDTRMEAIRQHQSGPRGAICEQLLGELAQAKQVLLDEERRTQYDDWLKDAFEQLATSASSDEADSIEGDFANTGFPIKVEQTDSSSNNLLRREEKTPRQKNHEGLEPNPILTLKNAMIFSLVVFSTMLVTIYLLSGNKTNTLTQPVNSTSKTQMEPQLEVVQAKEDITAPLSKQSADGVLVLSPVKVVLNGESMQANQSAISGWATKQDSAMWRLDVANRFTSYFHCEITYSAEKECRLILNIDGTTQRNFSLYPKDGDFTERFFVRLGQGEQRFKITAVNLESSASLAIKKIRLYPK